MIEAYTQEGGERSLFLLKSEVGWDVVRSDKSKMKNRTSLQSLAMALYLLTVLSVTAQTVPPVTTEWESGLIRQNGARPPASYRAPVSVDSDADRTLVSVWNREVNGAYYVAQYSRSGNQGQTWSEPKDLLPNPEQAEPLWREVHTVAAGKNGVWMAAVQLEEDSQQTTSSCGIVISTDSGLTWSDFQDLSTEVQLQQESYSLDVAYCGDSTWIFLVNANYGVRYIRSTDNGETWGPVVRLSDFAAASGAVQGHPRGNAVMITHYDDDTGFIVSRFSSDHGATFGPPVRATTGATDGAGNWVISLADNVPDRIPILHSSDNGQTFVPISSPPFVDDRINSPYKLAYSDAGEIVLIAYSATCFGLGSSLCFDTQAGLITRTSDLGQTWTPWERFGPNATNTVIPVDVTATPNNNFFAIMDSEPSSPTPLLHSFRLDLEPYDRPAAARDWQLYR